MRHSLLCSSLMALLLATPAIAAPASTTASARLSMTSLVDLPILDAAHWAAMTAGEKQALVSGVVEGIATDGLMHGLLGGTIPVDATTRDLYNYCAAHEPDLIAFLNRNYANPKLKVGVRAQVIGFFLKSNPDYNKRMLGVANQRLDELEKAHSPAPAPSK